MNENNTHARSAHPWPARGTRPYATSLAEGEAYWNVDILWIILAKGEDTGGQYSLLEQVCPRNSGPTPHYHDQDEWFYILEGEITFVADGVEIARKAGSFVAVPQGTVHSFRVDSETCRLLNGYSPAGFEAMVLEGAVPAERRELPPPGVRKAMDREAMMALLQKSGMHLVDDPDVLRGGGKGDWGMK